MRPLLRLHRATKGGYVERQQFLGRVDERRFELEREERARERMKREAAEAALRPR